MKSFSDHLFEAEFKRLADSGENYIFAHQKTIDGHNLQVMFDHRGNHKYEAFVSVNNRLHKSGAAVKDSNSKVKIASAAKSAVSHFIKHYGPREIYFSASEPGQKEKFSKANHYHVMAQSLAKKHGADLHVDGEGSQESEDRTFTLKFNR